MSGSSGSRRAGDHLLPTSRCRGWSDFKLNPDRVSFLWREAETRRNIAGVISSRGVSLQIIGVGSRNGSDAALPCGVRCQVPPLFCLILSALALSSCFVESQALDRNGMVACPAEEGVVRCDDSGSALYVCREGEVSVEDCDLGCTPGASACWVCIPGYGRCDGDSVVVCSADGSSEVPSAECAAGTCNDDGVGSAACGSCMPGTSRCDGSLEAVISCGSTGLEEAPVECAADERCEPMDGGRRASCVPNCIDGCDGDERVTCSPMEVRETCALGCNETTVECKTLVPSNVGESIDMSRSSEGLSVGVSSLEYLIFDTDDGGRIDRYNPANGERTTVRAAAAGVLDSGIYHEQVSASGAEVPGGATPPDLAVWVLDSLNVGAMGTMQFVGRRAAVLLVEGDVQISGRINVRGEWLLSGMGGREFLSAAAGGPGFVRTAGGGYGGGDLGVAERNRRSGGGGASFGSSGGRGGGAGFGAVVSEPGPVYGNQALTPLYGGAAGGAGADERSAGGDGGGALQISAGGRFTLAASGVIDASGEGGYGASADRGGGGGGGSGGGILLEAASVTVEGTIGAPGGGGGGGTNHRSENGLSGDRWDPPTELRGLHGQGRGSHGGTGGHGSGVAGGGGMDGESLDDPNGGGGGGGGGAGRIRLNVRAGQVPSITGTIVPSGALSSTGELSTL